MPSRVRAPSHGGRAAALSISFVRLRLDAGRNYYSGNPPPAGSRLQPGVQFLRLGRLHRRLARIVDRTAPIQAAPKTVHSPVRYPGC